jgi:hypothetical protein
MIYDYGKVSAIFSHNFSAISFLATMLKMLEECAVAHYAK